MSYYKQDELKKLGFLRLGKNVKISDRASIYNCNQICIGDNSRIDDFCVISGKIKIGKNVHITPMCLIAGGEKGIVFEDFVTIAYGVKVFSQSDDYSGTTMTNSTIPKKYKDEYKEILKKFNLPVIDFLDLNLSDDHFLPDGDHLNSKGALLATKYFAEKWYN